MWKLSDTAAFDRLAAAAAVALAIVGASGSLLAPAGAWLGAVGPAALGIAAGTRIGHRATLGLLGLLAAVPLAAWTDRPLFAQAAAGAIAGLVIVLGERLQKGLVRPGFAAATVALAAVAWPVLIAAMQSAHGSWIAQHLVPPGVVRAVTGALAGVVMAATALPLALVRAGDPVQEALARMRPSLDTELRGLLLDIVEARTRTLKLLDQSTADERTRTETRRSLEALALASIELSHRFSTVDHVLSRLSPDLVAQRAEALRAQLGEATDSGVRRDLERAAAALEEQREQLERLRQGRRRLLARLESELASLEKTEVSLALLASGDAAISGLRLEAIGAGLGRQAQELAAEGQALQETLAGPPADAVRRASIHA